MNVMAELEARFDRVCDYMLGQLRGGEAMSVDFAGEASEFMRFNRGRVRQAGQVRQGRVRFRYHRDGRTLDSAFETTGDPGPDRAAAAQALGAVRREAALLPRTRTRRCPPPRTRPGTSSPANCRIRRACRTWCWGRRRSWPGPGRTSWACTPRGPCAAGRPTAPAPGTGSPPRPSSWTIPPGFPAARRSSPPAPGAPGTRRPTPRDWRPPCPAWRLWPGPGRPWPPGATGRSWLRTPSTK